jgi:DnaJ-class molecular chaperone
MSIIDNFKDLKRALERNTQRDGARINSCAYCHGRGWVRPLKNSPFVPCPKCNGARAP